MDKLQRLVLESLNDLLAKLDQMEQTTHGSLYADGTLLGVYKGFEIALATGGGKQQSVAFRASSLAQCLETFLRNQEG